MTEKTLHVLDELGRWCPGVVEGLLIGSDREPSGQTTPPTSHSQPDAEAYCQRLATSQYENFPLIARLLPRQLRQPFFNVYAYCRWSDDLGDEVGDVNLSNRLLAWWRGEL
jgi:hypothetical protein